MKQFWERKIIIGHGRVSNYHWIIIVCTGLCHDSIYTSCMVIIWKYVLWQLPSTFSILWTRGGGNHITFCSLLNWPHSSHDFKPYLYGGLLSLYPLSCSNPSAPKVTIHLTSNWVLGQYLRHNLANKEYRLTCIAHTCHSSANLSISVIDTISSQLLSLKAEEAAWSPWTHSFLMVSSFKFTLNIVSLNNCVFPFFLTKATVISYSH